MSETPAIAARDDGVREHPKRRHKRTRTGCERCRAQHRKCDEEKPQCRRCADSGVACKYIARVSFLEKNSRTLPGSTSSRPSLTVATREYPALEFVVNKDSSIERSASGSPSTSTVMNHTGQPRREDADIEDPSESRPVFLMAYSQAQQDKNNNLQQKGIKNPKNAWPLAGRSSLSDDEVDLLKYYSHHVAPWLDVYDQAQTFGHLFTRLAMVSPCVLDGILQISATFSGRPTEMIQRRGVGALHLQALSNPCSAETGLLDLRLMAGFALTRTRLFVQDVPETWQPTFYKGGSSFRPDKLSSVDSSEVRIWSSSLALISRMEIAYYLINQTSPDRITYYIHRLLRLAKKHIDTDSQSHEALYASIHCLEILTDVMNLCLPISEAEDYVASSEAVVLPLVGASRVAKWKELLNELRKWQMNRPPELEQLIEVEGREAAFPVVIFAGGAGVSSNTLYHTAMLLLLGNRPQSISLAELHRNSELDVAQMSPFWHARRVCGIALNSEPEHTHCWDPCMIAAFALAARRMTHPAQQNDIVACLSRVKAAGWHIDSLVQRLRDEWGPVG
ncbi:hypothetical protein F5Y00DRAFT_240368 [Daldinia vernicosa]|uniref:uncharacterized protein n=1 Tax=Daldinia vernicosa TaxID=114800 RepID=UPI0020081B3F|nr:uncharacterized protein F5Y00DRAFT_240368 [Daldinia vernicosa]KAI0847754.1 hypothetical protein F5Y00DRAFT_240368 [Daldinia vernicosa]